MTKHTRSVSGAWRARRWVALVIVGAMTVSGCGDDDATVGSGAAGAVPEVQVIEAGTWVLERTGSTPAVSSGTTPTLVLRAGELHGDAPCNTYRGPVTIDGADIEIGDLATTMRSCGEATDRSETAYLGALAQVTTVGVDDDGRLLLSGGDAVRLVFSARATADLLTRSWHVRDLVMGDALVSVVAETDPVLTFADDGTLSIATGCNTATSEWTLDGDGLSIGPVAQTKMMCEEPAGVMDQEAALVAALEATASVEVSPEQLTLLTDAGTIALLAATDDEDPGA